MLNNSFLDICSGTHQARGRGPSSRLDPTLPGCLHLEHKHKGVRGRAAGSAGTGCGSCACTKFPAVMSGRRGRGDLRQQGACHCHLPCPGCVEGPFVVGSDSLQARPAQGESETQSKTTQRLHSIQKFALLLQTARSSAKGSMYHFFRFFFGKRKV